MALNLYKGFSTFEFQKNRTFSLRDVELVKMDLLNHIFTLRGTRVMMPTFGTRIPELAFEPLDEELLDELYAELKTVFDYDPRVEIVELSISPDFDTNSVYVNAVLFFVELNMTTDFDLNIQFNN